MIKKSKNPYYHIAYWIFVILILVKTFGLSWQDNTSAFYFVCMLLPIILGTSYFFNYFIVPKFYFTKRYKRFAFYTFCTAVISVYLEVLVLTFSFVYLVNFNYKYLGPTASQISLLAITLYLLVFIGSFFLMMRQITENHKVIDKLEDENEKMKKAALIIMSSRRIVKIPYDEIIYIESLSDYIRVITIKDDFNSKERISKLADRLPEIFLRIHRSFIINTNRIIEQTYDEVLVNDVRLNIGKSYRKMVKEKLKT